MRSASPIRRFQRHWVLPLLFAEGRVEFAIIDQHAGATALAAADVVEVCISAQSASAAGATVTSVESTATTGTFDGDGDDRRAAPLANNALALSPTRL